jgi:hypothetical protein
MRMSGLTKIVRLATSKWWSLSEPGFASEMPTNDILELKVRIKLKVKYK